MMRFLQAHPLFWAVPALALLAALAVLAGWRRRRRELAELSGRKRRDEALSQALGNPRRRQAPRGAERPVDVRWESRASGKTGRDGAFPLVELVEVSAYSDKRYLYRLDEPVQVGSGEGSRLELHGEGVAPRHCEIFQKDGKACVRSFPGAQVRLCRGRASAVVGREGAYLNSGDRLSVGTVELRFRMLKG